MNSFYISGLASPGPSAYDTLDVLDRRGMSTMRPASTRRAIPLMGPPGAPGRVNARYVEDEKIFFSERMERGRGTAGAFGPGPFALPPTYLLAAKMVQPRSPVQKIRPRSNKPIEPRHAQLPPRKQEGRSQEAAPQVVAQTIIGSERQRIRPASASTVRRYSAYAFPHEVEVPHFRTSAQPSARTRPQSAAPAVRVWSATPAVQVWRSSAVHGASSTGVKINPRGLSQPMRSAFVQPYGMNRVGQ